MVAVVVVPKALTVLFEAPRHLYDLRQCNNDQGAIHIGYLARWSHNWFQLGHLVREAKHHLTRNKLPFVLAVELQKLGRINGGLGGEGGQGTYENGVLRRALRRKMYYSILSERITIIAPLESFGNFFSPGSHLYL